MYSISQRVVPLEARYRNIAANCVPIVEVELPLTRAAIAAWLSTRRANVLCARLGHSIAMKTMSTAAQSAYMGIGDSYGVFFSERQEPVR